MRQFLAIRLLAWSVALVPGSVALAQQTPSIIDLHFHPASAWNIDAVVSMFDQLGVAKAGNGPWGPDEVASSFMQRRPERFVAFAGQGTLHQLIVSHGERAWKLDEPDTRAYLELLDTELAGGLFKGIGEIFANNMNSHAPDFRPTRFPADAPLMQRLFALSATYGVPVSVHMDAESASIAEMERLLQSNRQATWIWAHTGFFAEPPLLRRLLQQHSNLYCELSWRDGSRTTRAPITEGGRLRLEWKALLEELPDRFVIGTDVSTVSYADYTGLIRSWRAILAQLSSETAEKLAHRNAERILRLSPVK